MGILCPTALERSFMNGRLDLRMRWSSSQSDAVGKGTTRHQLQGLGDNRCVGDRVGVCDSKDINGVGLVRRGKWWRF